jgi:hypothetical protein
MTASSFDLVPLVEQPGTVSQKVHRRLLLAGCDMQAMLEVVKLIQELEDAQIRTLGELAGVRGGRDLIANLLRDSEERNSYLEQLLVQSLRPQLFPRLVGRAAIQ